MLPFSLMLLRNNRFGDSSCSCIWSDGCDGSCTSNSPFLQSLPRRQQQAWIHQPRGQHHRNAESSKQRSDNAGPLFIVRHNKAYKDAQRHEDTRADRQPRTRRFLERDNAASTAALNVAQAAADALHISKWIADEAAPTRDGLAANSLLLSDKEGEKIVAEITGIDDGTVVDRSADNNDFSRLLLLLRRLLVLMLLLILDLLLLMRLLLLCLLFLHCLLNDRASSIRCIDGTFLAHLFGNPFIFRLHLVPSCVRWNNISIF